MDIIKSDRSIIPACDVPTRVQLDRLVQATYDISGIGGYKVGLDLALGYGLPEVVKTIRKYTDKPIIYDHQKAATDIPAMGEKFAKRCKDSGVDTIILFPQAGPATQKAWTEACQKEELGVIVGGEMTHPQYLQSDGGYIADSEVQEIYMNAAMQGIKNFVVPGNKPEKIANYRQRIKLLFEHTPEFAENPDPIFFAPGFVAQGGKIADGGKAAGKYFHAIVGRGIYNPNKNENILNVTVEEMHEAAKQMTSQLIGD